MSSGIQSRDSWYFLKYSGSSISTAQSAISAMVAPTSSSAVYAPEAAAIKYLSEVSMLAINPASLASSTALYLPACTSAWSCSVISLPVFSTMFTSSLLGSYTLEALSTVDVIFSSVKGSPANSAISSSASLIGSYSSISLGREVGLGGAIGLLKPPASCSVNPIEEVSSTAVFSTISSSSII